MSWLLDTNAWILHLKNPGGAIEHRLNQMLPGNILLCSVVKAELWHGAYKYGRSERRLLALQTLFQPFKSLPFDDAAAAQYGMIRYHLENRGQIIGPNDLKIAAICLVHGVTLVTGKSAEFSRIDGLNLENWAAS